MWLGVVLTLAFLAPRVLRSADHGLTPAELAELEPEARLIIDLVQNQHYLGRPLSSIDGKELLDAYLRDLDSEALFFTKDDFEFLHRRFDRSLKPVYVFRGNLQPAFEIFDLLVERVQARLTWIETRVTQPFDLESDQPEKIDPKPAFLASGPALDDRWSRRLREHVIGHRLAGLDETAAATATLEGYQDWAEELPRTDALEIRERFLNALLLLFDPHSGYFSADSARAFDEAMGVASFHPGVGLMRRDQAWEISYLLPGGPAERHGGMERGDVLLALAEGDEPWREVTAMRYREIAQLLRGAADSTLRVAWLPPGSLPREEAELVRARPIVASQRARGAIWTLRASTATPVRVGWIILPAFYGSGERRPEAASVTDDVRELLAGMRATGVDGLVLDLRYNPGGSIPEAVALAGLFVESGTAMLARGLDGRVNVEKVRDDPDRYAGPLVVLVSEQSASSSELLAAALQHHRRALVVGADHTMGKGTMQAYVDLTTVQGTEIEQPNWGVLRLTSQLFYRPDGASIQRRGVVPDIVIPGEVAPTEARESELPLALPEETITDPAVTADDVSPLAPVTAELRTELVARAHERLATRPEFQLAKAEQALRATRDRDEWGRSLAAARAAQEAFEDEWGRLRREHRALAVADAIDAVTWIDVAEVAVVEGVHQQHLREDPLRDGAPRMNRLHRGVFHATRPDGVIVELWLGRIPFQDFVRDTAELAQAVSAATGAPVTADEIADLLRALAAVRERDIDAEVLACARRCLAATAWDDATVRRGIDALLMRICALDPAVTRPEAIGDFPLREALRIVADWVEVAPGHRQVVNPAEGSGAENLIVP